MLVASSLLNSCLLEAPSTTFVQVNNTPVSKYVANAVYSYDGSNYFALPDTLFGANRLLIDLKGGSVLALDISLNDKVVSYGNLTQAPLPRVIDLKSLTPGSYKLTITQQAKSGTGSLQDLADAEYNSVTTTSILVITSATAPTIKSVSLQNGRPVITWTPYLHDDFQYYEVTAGYDKTKIYRILNPLQTSIADSVFLGDVISYVVSVQTGQLLSSPAYIYQAKYNPKALLTKLTDNHFQLSWTAPPAHANVSGYQIAFNFSQPQDVGSQTTFDIYQPLDIRSYSYQITAYGSIGNSDTYSNQLLPGVPLPYIKSVVHDTQSAVYYLFSGTYLSGPDPAVLYRLDDKTFQVLDSLISPLHSIGGRVLASADGQYHYFTNGSQVEQIDPVSLAESGAVKFSDVSSTLSYAYTMDNMSISNNNLFIYEDETFYKTTVIDLTAKKILFQVNGASIMSYDNQYLLNGSNLYSFTGTTFTKLSTIPYASTSIVFSSFLNSTERIVLVTTSSVIIFDCSTQSTLATYNFSSSSTPPSLDQTSRKLLMQDPMGKTFTVDLSNGNQSYLSTVAVPAQLEGDALFGTVVYNNGIGASFVLKNY